MQNTLDQPEGRSSAGIHRAERGLAIALASISVATLLSWKLFPSVSAWPAAWALMHPTTALCMLLTAAVIRMSETGAPPLQRRLALAGAGVVAALAVLTLGVEVGEHRFILDDWLVRSHSAMSPQGAVGMLLVGALLPVANMFRGPLSVVADVLTLLLVDFVLVMLLGYVFSISSWFGESDANRITPITFLCFLICTALVVLRRSQGGVLAVLRGDGIGSRIVRIAIPLALLLPVALTLLRAYVVSQGLLDPAYATAASISVVCFCVALLALLMGWRINRLEQEVRGLLQKRSEAQLQESEQRYMELVEQSISGFVVRRADGRLILVNEAYRKMTGYSREELLQLSARDLVVDQGVLERVRRLEPGQSAHIETFLKRKDGSLLEVEYVTQRMRDGNLQSVLLDISHRKQLQKQRDESERRYAELVEQAQEGISVRRPAGGFLFVNDAFCAMLGYSRDELLRLSIHDVVHPEDVESTHQIQQMGHGGHLRVHKRMLRKDGAVIHVEVSAKRLRNGDIQSTVQDVTGRMQAEERFRAMVEGSPIAMLMVDRRGVLVLANPQAERLFGYTRDELIGQSIEMLVPARYRPGHPQLRTQYQAAPEMRAMGAGRDLFGLRKDGREVQIEIGLNPMVTAEGQVVLASVIDITERREAEQRERAYRDDLSEMSRRLSEAQETERRAIARELHDEVGQSLTATRINLRDLGQQAADLPLGKRLAETEEIIAELLGKVRQMSLDLHPSVLDDLGLVPALRWCVRTRAGGSPIQVRMQLPESLPRFNDMVEITLFRVFQEALSNALKHSGAAHLDVHLTYAEGKLLMIVKDDGNGFDAEAAHRAALSGRSLGLLGMQERARLAGGEMVVDSAPGKGAEVRVTLPGEER